MSDVIEKVDDTTLAIITEVPKKIERTEHTYDQIKERADGYRLAIANLQAEAQPTFDLEDKARELNLVLKNPVDETPAE